MSQFWFSRRNLTRLVTDIKALFAAVDSDLEELREAIDSGGGSGSGATFWEKYGLIMIDSTTSFSESGDGSTTIATSTNQGSITTVLSPGDPSDIIVTTVSPSSGTLNYIRTTTINNQTNAISTVYTTANKT